MPNIDANQVAQDIVDHVQRESHKMASTAATPVQVGADFCTIWGQAKPVLSMVVGFIGFMPGVGSIAAGVLKGLLAIGDQVASQICAQAKP